MVYREPVTPATVPMRRGIEETYLREDRRMYLNTWEQTMYRHIRGFYEASGFTGRDTVILGLGFGDSLPGGARVVGVDADKDAIIEALRKHPGIVGIHGDARTTPLHSGIARNVVAENLLSVVYTCAGADGVRNVIDEGWRLLVPGGQFIVIDTMKMSITSRSTTYSAQAPYGISRYDPGTPGPFFDVSPFLNSRERTENVRESITWAQTPVRQDDTIGRSFQVDFLRLRKS
jgi:SAM-dependent methyltransferase